MQIALEEREVTVKTYVPTISLLPGEFDEIREFYHEQLGKPGKFDGTYIDKIKICGNLGELECYISVED